MLVVTVVLVVVVVVVVVVVLVGPLACLMAFVCNKLRPGLLESKGISHSSPKQVSISGSDDSAAAATTKVSSAKSCQ